MPYPISPPGICLLPTLNWLYPFFCRQYMMTDYAFFSLGSDRWGKDLTPLWRHLTICPPLQQFHLPSIIQFGLSSLMSLKAWGRNRSSIKISPTWWYWLRRGPHRLGSMVFWPFGWTPVRPRSTLWRKQLGNWLPGSPVDLIGPIPCRG